MVAISKAEMALLVAAQQDERRRTLASIDASLHGRHTAQAAAVVARFAGRRAALSSLDGPGKAAVLQRLAAEESAELVRLALEMANEKRGLRQSALSALAVTHRAARRTLAIHQRRQRITFVVAVQPLRRRQGAGLRGVQRLAAKPRWRGGHRLPKSLIPHLGRR